MTRAASSATIVACVLFQLPGVAQSQTDTTVKATFGAFVDGYYAWDFGRPPSFDRSFIGGTLFTTQPARHNEFNVNLAFIEAKLDGARVHGRLALQAGTSVQSNYSGEPASGRISGATLSRHIQEAFAGVALGDDVWVDGGVFFSHMGMEGWISRDNPTYTRSLVAEYSPYYSSGVRVVWQANPKLMAQLHVVNGWQNISENNTGKGAGVRLDLTPGATVTVSYYNFFTDEAGNRLRTFNGVGAKFIRGRATLLGQFDLGTQDRGTEDGGSASWYGFTAIGRLQVTAAVGVSARVERYDDKDLVIIGTGGLDSQMPNGPFRANGGSIGLDVAPQARALWRTELRSFHNTSAIFPDGKDGAARKHSAFVVSSLALTF